MWGFNTLVEALFNQIPYVRDLRRQVEKQGGFAAGHYYSPIPDQDEALAYLESRKSAKTDLVDIRLNKECQLGLLNEYVQFYEDLPFPEKQRPDCRYYYDNDWFSYGDAIFLYSFLRRHEPRRIIEIGSGFSSAVMLDTVEKFLAHRPEITFVEPYPERLISLLRSGDEGQVRIITDKIQQVPPELFSSLESGDLVLIDSSHVVKCGNDLQLLMFDVLPFLPPGIFVHFHDILYPFEYPSAWLKQGRYWNESYLLRAFLSFNCEWNIYFFSDYVASSFGDFLKDRMPLCVKSPGSSLYVRRGEGETRWRGDAGTR